MWKLLTFAQQPFSIESLGNDAPRVAPMAPSFPPVREAVNAVGQIPVPAPTGTIPQTAQTAANEVSSDFARQLLSAKSELATSFETWTDKIWGFVTQQGIAFSIKLLAAVLLFYVGKWVSRLVTNFVSRIMETAGADPMLVRFTANVLYFACLVMVTIGALDVLGVPMGSATAVIAAGGFAIGLALQGSLSNFAAGIMLIVFKPFKVGDDIEAGGASGNVEEINIFNTVLKSGGNVQIIVPNGQITAGVIKNNSAFSIRKIELTIGCSYGDDLREVKQFLEKLLGEDRRILKDPAPTVAVVNLAESGVQFQMCPWVKSGEHGKVRSDLIEKIKLGFDERGFTIPFPSRDLYVHTANVLPMAKAA
jgi:small conductance mechanosensitive channel